MSLMRDRIAHTIKTHGARDYVGIKDLHGPSPAFRQRNFCNLVGIGLGMLYAGGSNLKIDRVG